MNVMLKPRGLARRQRQIGRWRLPALAVLVLFAACVLAQLLLPMIATDRLTSSLERTGRDVDVSITAFPAFELLFGHADTVTVHIATLATSSAHAGNLLARAANVGTVDATINRLDYHGLQLSNVSLRKRGTTITAGATVSEQAIRAILPINTTLVPTPTGSSGIIVHADASIFGLSGEATATVTARNGALALAPRLSGLGGLFDALHLTLFHNSEVGVDRVTAAAHGGTYTLTAVAHVR